MAYPDLEQFLCEVWGWGNDSIGALPLISLASNILVGSNPPFSASDLFALYPKFGGTAATVTGTLDGTSGVITAISSLTGLAAGQLVAGSGIPSGALITAVSQGNINTTGTTVQNSPNINVGNATGIQLGMTVSGPGIASGATVLNIAGNTLVLSANCTANGVNVALQFSSTPSITINAPVTQVGTVTLTIYVAPLLPLAILNAYIFLASNSIQQVRWQDMWNVGMCLYIAHYATLWLMSEAVGPNTTAAQAAASGLAMGIKVSKSAGDVSVGIKPIEFADWGTYGLTIYGQQLVTFAKVIGSGMMLIY